MIVKSKCKRLSLNSKRKKKFILNISILFGVFCILSVFTQNNANINEILEENDLGDINEKTLRKAGFWNENQIFIDELDVLFNWSYINKTYDWCNGAGIWDDPYIIENVTINANSYNFGILINNSNNIYFKIRNCTIRNSALGNLNAGIRLENSDNGTLINNTCSDNNENGILMLNCVNMTITDNTIENNTQYGVYINNSNCENNTIYNNRFIQNGINARDDSDLDKNNWNTTYIGNYWYNYSGIDANDDNIGDSPHTFIAGSAGSEDKLPIWWDAPVLSINAHFDYSIYVKKAANFRMTIDEGLGNYACYEFIEK